MFASPSTIYGSHANNSAASICIVLVVGDISGASATGQSVLLTVFKFSTFKCIINVLGTFISVCFSVCYFYFFTLYELKLIDDVTDTE